MQKKKIASEFHLTPERRTSVDCEADIGKFLDWLYSQFIDT